MPERAHHAAEAHNKDDVVVDARGLLCPLPVLRLRKRLMAMAPGEVAVLDATDPVAPIDVPHFCAEAGHTLLATEDLPDGVFRFRVRRGSPGPNQGPRESPDEASGESPGEAPGDDSPDAYSGR
ncbi:MAG: sulfurtransferase TusA family protein [Pseudomonadota bacterium]